MLEDEEINGNKRKKRITHGNSFHKKEVNLLAFQAYDLLYFTHTILLKKQRASTLVTRISLFLSFSH